MTSFEETVANYTTNPAARAFKRKALAAIGKKVRAYRDSVVKMTQTQFAEKHNLKQGMITQAETGTIAKAQRDIISLLIKEYGAQESDFEITINENGEISTEVQSLSKSDYIRIIEENNNLLREQYRSMETLRKLQNEKLTMLIKKHQESLNSDFISSLKEIFSL